MPLKSAWIKTDPIDDAYLFSYWSYSELIIRAFKKKKKLTS